MKRPLHKILLACFTLTLSTAAIAQSQCNNRDFEDTTFTGWSGSTGSNLGGVLSPVTWTNGYVSNGNNALVSDITSRHTIITQNFLDPNCIDPATGQLDTQMTSLAPGGGLASVRLGNSNMNYECEKISYPFNVTATNSFFQFQFSSIMEDPGHLWYEQPYFLVNFYDSLGIVIPQACDTIWAGDTTVPYITSAAPTPILYRRWTPISVDLSAYVGQQVTVEFVNSDCALGGHYGYTYIDVSCIGGSIANVWPGDCDYDLQANNVDLLTLGIAFGSTGPVRAGATNNWNAQPSADWSQSIQLGANYKHSDCNGDSIVDLNDTLAITLNYSQSHPFRLSGPGNNETVQSAPVLYLQPIDDTVAPGGIMYVDVYIANAILPVNNLYGISFDINYNTALAQSGTTFTGFSGSMLGIKNQNMLTLSHNDFASGYTDVGMCRFDHTEVNGYGYLCTIQVTAANVSNLSVMNFELSNVHAVNAQQVTIPLMPIGANVVIDPASSVFSPAPAQHVGLYPNPANETVTVSTEIGQTIEITNTLGQVVLTTLSAGSTTMIDISSLDTGVYFLSILSGNNRVTEQLIIE